MTPLGKFETALVAAAIVCVALRSPNGAAAALALVLILEIMKAM